MTSEVNGWIKRNTLVVVYVLFAVNVFLALSLSRSQTEARIEGDKAVTQSQIDKANELRRESDVRNCIGGVDFRLQVIGLAEDQLSPLPIDPTAPSDVRSQVEVINQRQLRLLGTIRQRFSPPACVATLGLDTDGDGWPEELEPGTTPSSLVPQPPPGTTIP